MKERERKTHDNRQHSILMDAKLVLLSQNVRVAISQSMLDYIYTCCATKREARHKSKFLTSLLSREKNGFQVCFFFFFFFLPEIGMIEMQSMIILLFSFSLTTVKKKRQKQERDDGLEEKRQDGEQTQDATL